MPWFPLPTADGDGGPRPRTVGSALEVVIAGLGGPSVQAIVVIHERWADVVGPEVAPHARPVAINEGTLQIGVDSPGWASHLRWSQAEILDRITDLIGPGQVSSVTVRTIRR